jgi:hypothetical protein
MVNYGGGNDKILVSPSGDTTGAADWTRITNAMTAAGPSGGTVGFEPGNYYLNAPLKWDTSAKTTIQLAPSLIGSPGMGGCDLAGNSPTGAVQLTAASSFPTGEFLIDYLGPAPSGGDGGNTGFRISGLVLQCGSKAAGVRSFNSEDSDWDHLVINQAAAPNPANTAGSPAGAVNFVASPSYEAFNNRCERVYVEASAQHSFYLFEGSGSYIFATNCTSVNAGWAGFWAGKFVTLTGCIAQSSGQNNPQSGYYNGEFECYGVTLVGCVSFASFPHGPGIAVSAEPGIYNSITGCVFTGTSVNGLAEAWAPVLHVNGGGNAHQTTFSGCTFMTGSHTSDYVNLDSSVVGQIVFDGCQFIPVGGSPTVGAYNLNGAAAYVKFASSPGINPAGTQTISVPATTVATAALPFDSTWYVKGAAGGTCTIAVTGGPTITIPVSTTIPVFVPAGSTVTPTYGAGNAPTWQVEGN